MRECDKCSLIIPRAARNLRVKRLFTIGNIFGFQILYFGGIESDKTRHRLSFVGHESRLQSTNII